MSGTGKLAIIGGSKEAVDLADHLIATGKDFVFYGTRNYPTPSGITPVYYDRKTDWAKALIGFDAVVVAPHPFAFSQLDTLRTLQIPTLALIRPEWQPDVADNWTILPDSTSAASALHRSGAQKPLLALGRERLRPFLALSSPQLIVRCRNKPLPDMGARGVVLFQPGPFTVEQERQFLRENQIDCIVVHNAGGQGGWPKLEAARTESIPVLLIARPEIEWDTAVEDVAGAIHWLRHCDALDLWAFSD